MNADGFMTYALFPFAKHLFNLFLQTPSDVTYVGINSAPYHSAR